MKRSMERRVALLVLVLAGCAEARATGIKSAPAVSGSSNAVDTLTRLRNQCSTALGPDMASWFEDFTGAPVYTNTGGNVTPTLDAFDGGRQVYTVPSAGFYAYRGSQLIPIVTSQLLDGWCLQWRGSVTSMTASAEFALVGLQGTTYQNWQATDGTGNQSYSYVGALGSTSLTNYVVKVFSNGAGPAVVTDTGVPMASTRDQEIELIADGAGKLLLFVDGALGWAGDVDLSGIQGGNGVPFWGGRNPSPAITASMVMDWAFAASGR